MLPKSKEKTIAENAPKLEWDSQNFWVKVAKNIKKDYWLYIFVIPAMIWYAVFCYAPMGGIVTAFKKFTGFSSVADAPWVGLKWFEQFFASYYSKTIIRNTIIVSLYSLSTFILPIIFALLINEVAHERLKKTIQTIMYAPHFISMVVMVSILSLFFNGDYGLINQMIEALGGESHSYLTDPNAYRHLYVWSGVWQQLGWNSVIYVAALSAVDPSLHEAASLDGATRIQRIIHINIPTIMPTIVIMLIMRVGNIMSVGGDKAILMLNSLNAETAELIATYVYNRGLLAGDYGIGTAVGLFTNVINLIMLLTVNWISSKISETSLL
ncbi:MAG: sugar ABC transporter permease [Ruminococcaceae bacterium]|nr:sugar ABC transporter permease [Oscillospiraceae bacterium]